MTDVLTLNKVTKLYSNGRGISDVSFKVKSGQIFGFLGPNGAGKTTTIRCIMDFTRPQRGSIIINGQDAQTKSVQAKHIVGYLPAENQLYPHWTGQDHIDFYNGIQQRSGSNELATRLNLDLHIQSRYLSTGNKQKLALILSIIGDPKLIIMDEPTKGLDPLLQQEIYEILKEYKRRGGTVFLSSHNLPEVEKICDSIAVIKNGQIVASETMESIRAMSIHIISLTSTKRINVKDFSSNTISILHQSDKHLILKVKGDINSVVSAASKYPLKDLEVTHANLEDIFLEYYR